jgi:glycosyltransferase involved in cell wall biosynthesis
MKVSGFTFVRNAIKFDYPVVEAIRSILPLCDEVVVAVGNSSDDTLDLVKSIDPKVRIVETVWDDSLKEGGRVLAVETDKALAAVAPDSDWAFYIQADEVLHERYLGVVRAAMLQYKDDKRVEGLLFNYLHFYGSYDYVGDSYRWYRHEIRVIKPEVEIHSYRDAQGFRKKGNRKLSVIELPATIHHYGWVRDPRKMSAKIGTFVSLYGAEKSPSSVIDVPFDYTRIDALRLFTDSHPLVMKDRISRMNWTFNYDPVASYKLRPKDRVKRFFDKLIGWKPGEYRNYTLVGTKNSDRKYLIR